MKNKWVLTVGVIIIVLGLFYAFNTDRDNLSDRDIVSSLVGNWKTFEKTIPERPVLGATSWNYPSIVQVISDDKLLIEYDDGHIVKYSVIGHGKKGDFTFVENVGKVNELSTEDWNLVELKYGNTSKVPVTFKHSPSVSGITKTVIGNDWIEVSENPFTAPTPIAKSQNTGAKSSSSSSIASSPTVSSVKIAFLLDSQDIVYRGKGTVVGCDKVVLVDRNIAPTTMPLNAAMKLLFNDRTPWPYHSGVPGNYVGGRPDVPITFSRATLESGVAKVYLYGNNVLSGECDDPRLTSQVEATAFQFPSVKSVVIYLNDKQWHTPSLKGE